MDEKKSTVEDFKARVEALVTAEMDWAGYRVICQFDHESPLYDDPAKVVLAEMLAACDKRSRIAFAELLLSW